MSFYLILGVVVTLVSASGQLLSIRNNPPQPPCVYPYTKFVYSGCFGDSVSSRALPFMTELEFNNATVEQCTAYCKGNDYRYAGLEYHGQCFCGTSVSAAVASEGECNLPCNGDPTQVCGGQDRISIYQDPTFPDADDIAIASDYLSLGCYTEGNGGRSLDYSQWDFLNSSAMTTETCLDACGSKGFPFVGTEFGRECYCGVVLGNGTTSTSVSECSTPCTGNSTQSCGGVDRLSLYVAKNLESTEPCGPPVISSSITTTTPTPTPTPSATPPPYTTVQSNSTTPPYSTIKTSSTLKPSSYSTTKISSSSKPPSTSSKPSTTPCKGWLCPPVHSTVKTTAKSTSTKKPSTSCHSTVKSSTKKPSATASYSTIRISSSIKTSSTLKTTGYVTVPTSKLTSKSKATSTTRYGWWV
ncbi:WSC-domain-containing protein [Massarina eburnea CBS 473.64]|uniref:WSC-domain-containing protein n=1 Tax=Massarina eburnea CBS 473.64 TaxID=1395130 RepID=A0A6A6RZC9_9PLEO|nr:WSC-domain-containing protein [Massarina eburnea CBS 473.64]